MVKQLIDNILKIASIIYPLKLISWFAELNSRLFSIAISRKIAQTGRGFRVASDIILVGPDLIRIGDDFQAFARLRLEAIANYRGFKYSPEILIGNNVSINLDCHIGAINRIDIGDNVLIGSRVTLVDHSHGDVSEVNNKTAPTLKALYSKGPLRIGRNTWIGEGVTILGNVTLGENVIVGANSLVNKSFPSNVVIAGVPAKIVRCITTND